MAQMSPTRRSQLLNLLLRQQQEAAGFRGNKTGAEMLARLGAAFLNKKTSDKLQEEEAAATKTNEAVVANAIQQQLGGSPQSVFGDIKTEPGQANDLGFVQAPSKTAPATQKQKTAALAQALSKNPKNPALNMMLQQSIQPAERDVIGRAEIKEGSEYVTYETINGKLGKEIARGPRRQEIAQGLPSDFGGTESQIGKHSIEFGKQVGAINAWGKTGTEFLTMLRENPGANTVVASLANMGSRLMGEVKAMKNQGVYNVEEDFRGFEVSAWEDVFSATGLAGASPRAKRGFLALAIQGAAASGLGTGRALSDRDVEHQLKTLGASQTDPDIIAGVFADSYQNMGNTIRAEQELFPYLNKFEVAEYDFGAKNNRRTWNPVTGRIE